MKIISTKTVQVVSNTYEMLKKPDSDNQNSGNVSVSYSEIEKLTAFDHVLLVVLNEDDTVKTKRLYSGAQFINKAKATFSNDYFLMRYIDG